MIVTIISGFAADVKLFLDLLLMYLKLSAGVLHL
jgi:hypothetical protein